MHAKEDCNGQTSTQNSQLMHVLRWVKIVCFKSACRITLPISMSRILSGYLLICYQAAKSRCTHVHVYVILYVHVYMYI